jgi:hypothetical protein
MDLWMGGLRALPGSRTVPRTLYWPRQRRSFTRHDAMKPPAPVTHTLFPTASIALGFWYFLALVVTPPLKKWAEVQRPQFRRTSALDVLLQWLYLEQEASLSAYSSGLIWWPGIPGGLEGIEGDISWISPSIPSNPPGISVSPNQSLALGLDNEPVQLILARLVLAGQ